VKLEKIYETLLNLKLPDEATEEDLEGAFKDMIEAVAPNDPVRAQLPLLDTYPSWRDSLLSAYLALVSIESTYLHRVMTALAKAPAASSHEGIVL